MEKDGACKRLLMQPRVVREFAAGFLPAAAARINRDSFRRYPTETVSRDPKQSQKCRPLLSDVMRQFEFDDAACRYALLMETEGLQSLTELPPIIAAVIYNGEQPWDVQTQLSGMIAKSYDWVLERVCGAEPAAAGLIREFIVQLKGQGCRSELAEVVRQQEGEPMVARTALADLEQQMQQREIQQGMQDSKRECARLRVGDGKSEQEMQRYTGLLIREIREIRRRLCAAWHRRGPFHWCQVIQLMPEQGVSA